MAPVERCGYVFLILKRGSIPQEGTETGVEDSFSCCGKGSGGPIESALHPELANSGAEKHDPDSARLCVTPYPQPVRF